MNNLNKYSNDLKKNSFMHKNIDTKLVNIADNETAYRVYRDISTEKYTETIINNIDQMKIFLDYTFHAIYSYIICNLETTIFNSFPIIKTDYTTHIKPLVGNENIYLLFKGGSLMKNFYDMEMNKIKLNNKDISIDDIRKKYNIDSITDFNYNLEDLKIDDNSVNTFEYFCDKILTKKFAISDTDYTLYINASSNERFIILFKLITEIMADVFDIMTNKFDKYYNNVMNELPTVTTKKYNFNNIKYFPNVDITNKNTYMTIENEYIYGDETILLKLLRSFLDDNTNIDNLVKFTNSTDIIKYINNYNSNIMTLINNLFVITSDNIYNIFLKKNIYYYYNYVHIFNLLKYITNLNSNFIINTTINLDQCLNCIKNLIELSVEHKFDNIIDGKLYTIEKFKQLKTSLVNEFIKKYQDSKSTLKNKKYRKLARQSNITDYVDTYELTPNLSNITDSNINIEPTKSIILTTNPDPTKDNLIINSNVEDKIHFISYNSTIYKLVGNGLSTINFDLMRSKFNIMLKNCDCVTKNNVNINLSIPSEFIDVSIPRYDDSSRKHFFEHLENDVYHLLLCDTNINNKITSQLLFLNKPMNNNEIINSLIHKQRNQDLIYPNIVDNLVNNIVDNNNIKKTLLNSFDNIEETKKKINKYIDKYLEENYDVNKLISIISNKLNNKIDCNQISLMINERMHNNKLKEQTPVEEQTYLIPMEDNQKSKIQRQSSIVPQSTDKVILIPMEDNQKSKIQRQSSIVPQSTDKVILIPRDEYNSIIQNQSTANNSSKINIQNGGNNIMNQVIILSYSPMDILDDLIYVLVGQKGNEPWDDAKYKKRIIRCVVMAIIILNYIDPNDYNENIMYLRETFNLFYEIYLYINNKKEYPLHTVIKFIDGYNKNDTNNNRILMNYILTIKDNLEQWITHHHDIPQLFINKKYIFKNMIYNVIFWSFLYKDISNPNKTDLIVKTLNTLNNIYLKIPSYNKDNILLLQNKYLQYINILYDYGFKLLYAMEYKHLSNDNILNGGNKDIYYHKYIKYKAKYMELKNK